MTTQTLTVHLPRPHPEQRRVIREASRFNVLACGRRWGKSTLGVNRLVQPAIGGGPVAWFSPTYRMLTEIWRDVRRALAPITARVDVQQRRIELVTGGVIEMWSLDQPDTARGRKYRRVVVDEAALVRDLADVWGMVLRPTLADYQGDAWFLSTPQGRNGFAVMYDWGRDPHPAHAEWTAWQMPTAANPYIPPAEIEAMRRTLPERTYAQEIDAVFLDDAGGVLRRVRDAATATARERAEAGHAYVFGVDWGKLSDFTVVSVIDSTRSAQVALDRFHQIDYAVQMGRLRALAEQFQPVAIIAERNSMGEPLVEQAIREGLPVQPFTTTNASKAQVIDGLALALERGELAILPDPIQLEELMAYEAERLPSGLVRYGAPAGLHDDTVMALALAWYGASAAGVPMQWDEA